MRILLLALSVVLAACTSEGHPTSTIDVPVDSVFSGAPIYVVLYTDLEDSLPDSDLSFIEAYSRYRDNEESLFAMSRVMRDRGMTWSVQPDRTFLNSALLFGEDLYGVDILRYLRDSAGVSINPHSLEGGGYNYADVAHLLDLLGVGGSDIAAGHVRNDSSLIDQWERLRFPLRGLHFPDVTWQARIITGEVAAPGTSDVISSGVWRPESRTRFFDDNPLGSIVSIGSYTGDVDTIRELTALSARQSPGSPCMLTVAIPLRISVMRRPEGTEELDRDILQPLAAMRQRGEIVITDYSRVVDIWRRDFQANGCVLLRNAEEK